MGKREDTREKRRWRRRAAQQLKERQASKEAFATRQEAALQREALSCFTPDGYGASFGVALACAALLEWVLLRLVRPELFGSFAILKVTGLYLLGFFIAGAVKPKEWLVSALLRFGLVASPIPILINVVLDGKFGAGIQALLLAIAACAVVLSALCMLLPVFGQKRYYVILAYTLACPAVLAGGGMLHDAVFQGGVLLGAVAVALTLGWCWAVSWERSPRTWVSLIDDLSLAHLKTLFTCIALALNLWVVLFIA